jgi:hypothetical protein
LRLSFASANPHPVIEPFDRLDTHISFFRGIDRTDWRPEVPVWGGVRYVDLYPGIDLELTGRGGKLNWRFVNHDAYLVAPKLDMRLRVEGAEGARLEKDFFHLFTGAGDFHLPLISADEAISEHRSPVLALEPEGIEISAPFAAGPNEPQAENESLVVGSMIFSSFLGGNGAEGTDDEGRGIAVDSKGAVYITGYTQSAGFPVTPGAFDTTSEAFADAFVAKLNSSGSKLVYATYLGGDELSQGNDIAVDGSGVAYITGRTSAANFPTTPKGFDTIFNESENDEGFVVKLNPTGSALIYATFLGGNGSDWPEGIALDTYGKVYVTGQTDSSDFPITPGAFDPSCGSDGNCNADPYGKSDVFVTKLNSKGTALEYSTYLGGKDSEVGYGIARDLKGASYITGYTTSPDFPVTPGAFDLTCGADGNCDATEYAQADAFVVKLTPSGSTLDYATFIGGSAGDASNNIALDGLGNAYVTGQTWSFDFPVTASAFDGSYGGWTDAFVAKLDRWGSQLVYATLIGGSGPECDQECDIAVNGSGEAFLTGFSASADFPTTPGALDHDCSDGDVYLAKINKAGSGLMYATCLGGSNWEGGRSISLDRYGFVYLTGWTSSTDFPTTPGAFDRSYNGEEEDIFLTKMQIK